MVVVIILFACLFIVISIQPVVAEDFESTSLEDSLEKTCLYESF